MTDRHAPTVKLTPVDLNYLWKIIVEKPQSPAILHLWEMTRSLPLLSGKLLVSFCPLVLSSLFRPSHVIAMPRAWTGRQMPGRSTGKRAFSKSRYYSSRANAKNKREGRRPRVRLRRAKPRVAIAPEEVAGGLNPPV